MKIPKYYKTGFRLLKITNTISKRILPLNILLGLTNTAFQYAGYFFLAIVIDRLIESKYSDATFFSALLIISNLLLSLIINKLNKYATVEANLLFTDFKTRVRDKALLLSYDRLSKPGFTGEILDGEFTTEIEGGIDYLIECFRTLLSSAFSIIVAFIMSVQMLFFKGDKNPSEQIVSIILYIGIMVFLILSNVWLGKKTKVNQESSVEGHERAERGVGYFSNVIYGDADALRNIKMYDMQDLVWSKCRHFHEITMRYFADSYNKRKKQNLAADVCADVYIFFSVGLIFMRMLSGAITIGAFTAYYGAFTQFSKAFPKILQSDFDIKRITDYMEIFADFLDENKQDKEDMQGYESKNSTDEKCKKVIPDGDCNIEFHDVSYRYPGTDKNVLEHINVSFSTGEKSAIVGLNGAGKTTLIGLLCGLYQPSEGYITLNGVNILEYDHDEYMKLFSCVFQDFRLFDLTVGENISCVEDYDRKRALKIINAIGLRKRIDNISGGIESDFIGEEENTDFSGGEKQKLAIGRAIFRNARFMILDEPTSALDPVSEEKVYEDFAKMTEDKTGIFISHRMSSCLLCDRIIVMKNGKVTDIGCHKDLLEKSKLYSKMWNAQAKYYVA